MLVQDEKKIVSLSYPGPLKMRAIQYIDNI